MAVTRANPYLQEIIEILDIHRQKYRSDEEAVANFSKDDSAWVDQEMLTCITDKRYFISNYYFYRDEKEGFKGLYPLFDSQEILFEEYARLRAETGKVRALVLKARQMGSTTYNCAEFFTETIFSEHINGIIVGPDESTSSYVMGMYESALDFLPYWMRPRIKIKQTGSVINFDEKDEQYRATNPGLKTWIYADNARKPTGVGRGKTFGRGLLTEVAFWQNGSQLSKSLTPTFNTPDGFYVMESTPNGRNDLWHNLWRRAEAGKVDWHPIYIPFYRRAVTYSLPLRKGEVFEPTADELEMRAIILAKEDFLVTDATFNWMRNRKEEYVAVDGDDMMFSQEYSSNAEESFQSSAVTAFPRGTINRYSKLTLEPLWVGEITYDWDKGEPRLRMRELKKGEEAPKPETEDRLHMWEKVIPKAEYAVGVDVALGSPGGDYSVAQVIKKGEGHDLDEQVAVWHGHITPEGLSEIVLALGWYYNEALACVEVNSFGMQTNSVLMRNYEYENIYRFKRLDRLNNAMTNIVGWWSDPKSTDALMAKMAGVLADSMIRIRDKHTIDEFRDYTEDGAVGEGAHDDLVDALMIGLYCLNEGLVRERRETRKPSASSEATVYEVKDRWGTKIGEMTSRNQAELMQKKFPGSFIDKKPGTGPEAMIEIAGRKMKVPATAQNTDHSPVHDKAGSTQSQMYDEGIEPEEMTPEAVALFEAEQEEAEESENAWLYS